MTIMILCMEAAGNLIMVWSYMHTLHVYGMNAARPQEMLDIVVLRGFVACLVVMLVNPFELLVYSGSASNMPNHHVQAKACLLYNPV